MADTKKPGKLPPWSPGAKKASDTILLTTKPSSAKPSSSKVSDLRAGGKVGALQPNLLERKASSNKPPSFGQQTEKLKPSTFGKLKSVGVTDSNGKDHKVEVARKKKSSDKITDETKTKTKSPKESREKEVAPST